MPQRRTVILTDEQRQHYSTSATTTRAPTCGERCAALLKVAAGQSAYAVGATWLAAAPRPRHALHLARLLCCRWGRCLLGHRHGGVRRSVFDRRDELDARLRQGPAPRPKPSGRGPEGPTPSR